MKAVNLLPENRRPGRLSAEQSHARAAKATVMGAGVVMVAAAGLISVAGMQARSVANDKQTVLAGIKQELEATRASSAAASTAQQQVHARFAAFSTAAAARIPWDGLLYDLSRVMPRDAWLSNLTTQAPDPADSQQTSASSTEAVPTAFLITGFARSQNVVPLVLERLALIPSLSDVGLDRTQSIDVGQRKAVQFTIGANLRVPGGS